MDTIFSIDSITELHHICGIDKPTHPLVTVIDVSKIKPLQETKESKVRLGFYSIAMKSNVETGIKYGRQYYDFQEGSLIFMAPEQVSVFDIAAPGEDAIGWMLCVHPEFIRGSGLSQKMDDYNFFSYSANEALHLSEKEKSNLTAIVESIQDEITQNIDPFTKDLILNNLELTLNYSDRYYSRQFLTRTNRNKDIITEFESLLKKRFQSGILEDKGIPTVKELATVLGYSPYYLSDLLKKETGKGTQEYIQEYVINRAKDLLISTDMAVNQIGYHLGFEYPAHFSKFFKNKTGMSPGKYRQI